MEENEYRNDMMVALLESAPEEVAFQWVFERSVYNLNFYLSDFVWPHDKDRTLTALKPEKRPVTDMREFYIPMLSGRADILLEIIKGTSRKTVIQGIIDVAQVKHISPAQYQALRLAALEKLGADRNSAIPDRLDEWLSEYGDEAAEAFVWTPHSVLTATDTGEYQLAETSCPVGYLSSPVPHQYKSAHWRGRINRAGSLTGLLEATSATTAKQIKEAIFHYVGEHVVFPLDELRNYLAANQIKLSFSSTATLKGFLRVLPREFFKGIQGVQRAWEALSPFIHVNAPDVSVEKTFALCIDPERNPMNGLPVGNHLNSFEEYAALHSPAFYSFSPIQHDGSTGPLEVLTREQYLKLIPGNDWIDAAKHIVSLFALDWDAALVHTNFFPELGLLHMSFDPYAKAAEILERKKSSAAEWQAALCGIQSVSQESLDTAPDSARKLLKTAAYQLPVLANKSNSGLLMGLGKFFTASEVREAIIEATTDKLLGSQGEYTLVKFLDDLECVRSIASSAKGQTRAVTFCSSQQLCKAVANAYQVSMGTGSKSEELTLEILQYLRASAGSCNPFEEDCLRAILEELVDYTDPVGSISRFLDAASLSGTVRGNNLLVSMAEFGQAFSSASRPGWQLLQSNEDFRNFVLEAYKESEAYSLPSALGKFESDFVISGELPLSRADAGALWFPKVLQRVREDLQDSPIEAWETYLNLSEHWDGTLPDLIDTVLAAN